MFAGIDIAAERHVLARLDAEGAPIARPMVITEDREGYAALIGDCQEFRVGSGIVGAKESQDAATQRPEDPGRHPRPALGWR